VTSRRTRKDLAAGSPLAGVDLEALLRANGIDPAVLGGRVSAAVDGPFGFTRFQPAPLDPPAESLVFRVRLDLVDARPPVWRRLELAGDLTLDHLHQVLQAAMGWSDSHLHSFVMGPGRFDPRRQGFLTDADVEEGEEGVHEADVRLDQVVREVGDKLHYEYDFGDGWQHVLKVEDVRHRAGTDPRATCLGGARACPPEDIGGVHAYREVVEALAGRADHLSEELSERLDWLPDDFDPLQFDPEATDADVRDAAEQGRPPVGFDAAWARLCAPLDPAVSGVALRLPPDARATVALWVGEATAATEQLDDDVAAHVAAPWQAFLTHVGDGLRLTGAGYLTPATVEHLVAVLDAGGRLGPHADIVFGKGNREEHVRPAGHLWRSAKEAGLLRKSKGMLLPTKVARAVHGDDQALARLLADRLPRGRADHERDAGALLLLAAAAGHPLDPPTLAQHLGAAGWEVDGRSPDDWVAWDWARPTSAVLAVAGWNPGRASELAHEPAVAAFARLAVRAG
jgi:hypothetical protein